MSARTHVIAGYFMWTKEGRHLGYGQQEEAKIRQTLL